MPIRISPMPFAGGFYVAPSSVNIVEPTGPSLWYGYFSSQSLPADSQPHPLTLIPAQSGTAGNAELFETLPDGVRFTADVIVQITAWALISDPAVHPRWIGLQLDKAGTLLVRAHTAFVERAANVAYGGVLSAGDILRAVAQNGHTVADDLQSGFLSIVASAV